MNLLYKIRVAIPDGYIEKAIYVVLVAIFFNLVGIAAAHADDDFWQSDLFTGRDEFEDDFSDSAVEGIRHEDDAPSRAYRATDPHDDPDSNANSVYRPENDPDHPKNSEHSPKNSRYSREAHIIRDNSGNATGYWKRREDGGVNIYGYDGKGRTGYIPAPRSNGRR